VRAPAEGYALLAIGANNAINAPVTKKLNFNLLRDVELVAGIYRVSLVMELHPSFPARTAPEFIAYAKADLGKVQSLALGRSRSPGGRGKSALLEAESAIDLFQEEAPVLACTRGLSRRLS
jgi:tripartite-type tricarboxylate transporter receptor subunit TctC